LNIRDFRPKTRNFFLKNFKMIHSGQDNALVAASNNVWAVVSTGALVCKLGLWPDLNSYANGRFVSLAGVA
jgi:hypothetical protein